VEALRAQARLAVTPEGRALLQETLREEEARLAGMAREAERHTYVRGLAHDRGLVYSCGGEGGLRVWSLAYEKCVGEVTALGGGGHALAVSAREEAEEEEGGARGGGLLGVVCRDAHLRVFGGPDTAAEFGGAVRRREDNFLTRGGEVWALNLATNTARMLLPRIQVPSPLPLPLLVCKRRPRRKDRARRAGPRRAGAGSRWSAGR
jgi:hypothetical protein